MNHEVTHMHTGICTTKNNQEWMHTSTHLQYLCLSILIFSCLYLYVYIYTCVPIWRYLHMCTPLFVHIRTYFVWLPRNPSCGPCLPTLSSSMVLMNSSPEGKQGTYPTHTTHSQSLSFCQLLNQPRKGQYNQKPSIILGVDSPFFSTIAFPKTSRSPWVSGGFLERRIPGKDGEGTNRIMRVSL